MNLALLDSELFELPEMIEDRLQVPPDEVVVCTFNGRGNLLAGGCLKGTVVVWDFDTHGVARTLLGHSGRVTGVHWTRSSRKLLSGSADGKLVVWDVLNSVVLQTVDMGSEVMQAALHPRRRAVCLACVGTGAAGQAFLVSLLPGAEQRVALLPQADAVAPVPAVQEAAAGSGSGEPSSGASGATEAPKGRRDAVSAACFDREGTLALVGTSRGAIHLVRVDTQELVASVQLPGGAAIKSLVLSRNGKSFVANSSDRIIRACSLERVLAGEKPALRELQDVVNRVQWSHAAFSSESEHVIGTAYVAADHLVYIWDMQGLLVNILGQGDKVKDGALYFACHPTRPILACCARSGAVYIWTKRYSENWSAFAPDFKELEENEEYAEREDEFDIVPQAETKQQDDEDELIDIVTIDPTELNHVPDADDDDEELLFLPTQPEPEATLRDGAAAAGPDADAMDVDGAKGGKGRGGKRKVPGQ